MGILVLIAFIGVPLIEIGVFIQVGGFIGLWPTMGLIVLTAVLGTWQLRAQGLATLNRARQQIDQGVLPAHELFDGLCLLVAGALLLTPGFVTDATGFLLFLPPVRAALRQFLARHVMASAQTRAWVDGDEVSGRGPKGGRVIDGEFEDLTDEPRSPGNNNRTLPR
jgi:UPF0716 protein FxsA